MLTGKMDGPPSQSASFLAHLQDGRDQLVQDHLLSVAHIAGTYSGKVGADVAGNTIGLLHDLREILRRFSSVPAKNGGNARYGRAGGWSRHC